MKRLCVLVGIAALSGLLAGFPSAAQEQRKAEKLDPATAEAFAKFLKAQDEIHAAYTFVEFGRRTESPEAILAAVQILRQHPIKEPKDVPGLKLDASKLSKNSPKPLESQLPELIQEARDMRPDDKTLAALADRAAQSLKESTRELAIGYSEIPVRWRVNLEPGMGFAWHQSRVLAGDGRKASTGSVVVRFTQTPPTQPAQRSAAPTTIPLTIEWEGGPAVSPSGPYQKASGHTSEQTYTFSLNRTGTLKFSITNPLSTQQEIEITDYR